MKIAMLYAAWDGEGWSTPIGFRNELQRRGHEIQHYNLYHRNGEITYKGEIRKYSNEGINRLHADYQTGIFKPDLVMLFDYGMFDAVQFDKKYIPEAVWVTEQGDEPQSHRQQWNKATKVDLVLSPDWPCVNRYVSVGLNAKFWTHCADTALFYPRPEIPINWDCVTTCGPRGGGLTEQIKAALGERFNNERYFYGEDHAKRLNMGKIVFQCSQHKEWTRRVPEGMACGKLVITDKLPEGTKMHEYYVDGTDIVFYENADDAIEKIRYYAENDKEREAIATNGFRKTVHEHSVISRTTDLLNWVEEIRNDKLKA